MEGTWKVEFRNVGRTYFPQSRVECHYSLGPQHVWSSSDWIGLFKVGWSSMRDYHTFVWALAPAGYQAGAAVNCCVHFQASYLPRPGADPFQFVYVDGKGEVCARSSPFTFCAPKPLEDLVTLEQEGSSEDGGADLLLVVPRAELLQGRLEDLLRERAELLRARDAAERSREVERELRERVEMQTGLARAELEGSVAELKERLTRTKEKVEELEKEQEMISAEREGLMVDKAESHKRIRELEEQGKSLMLRGLEREAELDRMRERMQNLTAQKRDEDEEMQCLKAQLEQSEADLRTLGREFQELRSLLAQRDTQVLQLRGTISTLSGKLQVAQGKEEECEAALKELQELQGRLATSEGAAEGLKAELTAIAARCDQSRLEAAQLTLQLADSSLALRESRAAWLQEREALQQGVRLEKERVEKLSKELQQKEKCLQEEKMEREKVQLSESWRELEDLKASLRMVQNDKEQLLLEKQEMLDYMRQLEQRLDAVADAKWSEAAFSSNSRPDSPVSDFEDDALEAGFRHPPPPLAPPLGPYGLCEAPLSEALILGTPPPSPRDQCRGTVVISQPAPLSSPRQPGSDIATQSLDSEEEPEVAQSEAAQSEMAQSRGQSSRIGATSLPLDQRDSAPSDFAGAPLW
ncbi:calcium-binding and coiled-coil domain-containing protein 1 isoform X3 [Brienomyrus brachyistius]|uniref:calcium-binding and coiled-coil domain-containing protein 1 isoform X3 n=1 Tax=Brienomyrus brachyistius TaxID=42636 RepID=UPI0020B2C93F|nr:calcium-binding and coiled-coil domain-containing protein 1 isoform X3 [Brienomyrus brachyistius]